MDLNDREDTKVISVRGGQYEQLTKIAVEELKAVRHIRVPKFVYFVAGLTDTTTKLRKRDTIVNSTYCKYEEVIYANSSSHVINLIDLTANTILQEQATPIFCTIAPAASNHDCLAV